MQARRTRSSGSRVPLASVIVSTWLSPGSSRVFDWSHRYTLRLSAASPARRLRRAAPQPSRPIATPERMVISMVSRISPLLTSLATYSWTSSESHNGIGMSRARCWRTALPNWRDSPARHHTNATREARWPEPRARRFHLLDYSFASLRHGAPAIRFADSLMSKDSIGPGYPSL